MKRIVEIFLVIVYNLTLVTGASYLVVFHNVSAWIYVVALFLAATWDDTKSMLVGNIVKVKHEEKI